MPSDSNGVYSLPDGYLATTGATIQASQHNPPLEDLAASMSARLMRSGAAPMTGPVKVVDGSSGSPSVQFANATSTGLYKTTNGIGVSIGGALVAEFGSGGLTKGGKIIGETFGWTGSSAPAMCVLPYGQTLSRTTYADLWAFAQTEIAAGNTFYNNGNGTTTFGVGDLRGRAIAGNDSMGGTAAGRITVGNFGASPSTIGNSGGTETKTLTVVNLPPYTPTGSVSTSVTTGGAISQGFQGGGALQAVVKNGLGNVGNNDPSVVIATATSAFVGAAQGGTSTPLSIMQPTLILNFALFAGA